MYIKIKGATDKRFIAVTVDNSQIVEDMLISGENIMRVEI